MKWQAVQARVVVAVCTASVGLLLTACSDPLFSSADGGPGAQTATSAVSPANLLEGDLMFINDSFERDDIYADLVNEIIFGWRGFILDGANQVFAFQSNGAGARIPPAGEFGPAADGERFLLMNGRENSEMETIHVISQTYDLSQFNTVLLSFKYISFGLNDVGDVNPEKLEVQVCRGTLNECGANDDALNGSGLLSDKWVTVATNDSNINDDALNGKNHILTDWQSGLAVIDLRDRNIVGDGSTFVFRFRAAMNSGLTPDAVTEVCEEVCSEVCDGGGCCREHHDNGKHVGFDHSKHYGYGKKHCCHKNDEGACKHDNGKHEGFDHSKHNGYGKNDKCCKCCDKDCHTECHTECHTVTVPSDGTLKDGVGVDSVTGIATPRTVEEIF